MRPPSLPLRLTRAFVGLVTVWCLGCSGYESILTSLFGGQAGATMSCDGVMAAGADSSAIHTASSDETGARAASATRDGRGFDCGCGSSCHAPAPRLVAVSTGPAPLPVAIQFAPSAPSTIARAPLLPPPESAV